MFFELFILALLVYKTLQKRGEREVVICFRFNVLAY